MNTRNIVVVLLMLLVAVSGGGHKKKGGTKKRLAELEQKVAALEQINQDVVGHSESGFVHSEYFRTSPAVRITECPDGWTDLGWSCVVALPDRGSFEDQQTACQDLDNGAFIAVPMSEAEQRIIMNLTSSTTFIGVVRAEPGKPGFLNIVGGALDWSNWRSGEPNNAQGNENCVVVYQFGDVAFDGFWNDVPCSKESRAVCEIKKLGDATIIDREIVFDRSFTTIPNVILSVTVIDAENRNLRYIVEALDVTTNGFRLKMISWGDTHIYQARVNWEAVPDRA